MQIKRLTHLDDATCAQLADILIDCVEGGASVSFMLPLSQARAEAFWQGLRASVEAGERALLVAEDAGGQLLGTVQVVLAQPENQPHRADIAKLLVHRRGRRLGVGQALMEAAERAAIDEGKSVLVLDTATGGDAERLYQRLGWQRTGQVPAYALWPAGGLCATTIFHKRVGDCYG
ncbi:GNAT family N-acetyltransferase [Pseudomonas sp. App30]|uniref:GNAT family N-acetyltransferase n=1 Tax=Pseudomonas sp. App30 TaxID=3068990 RepID=UPI003A7F9B6E